MATARTKTLPVPTFGDLLRLKPMAYWRTFWGESLAFKFACIYLMFEYVRPQSIYTAIDVLPFGLVSLAGGVAVVMLSREERSQVTYGSKLPLLLLFDLARGVRGHNLVPRHSGFDRLPEAG